eukprot:g20217.t1
MKIDACDEELAFKQKERELASYTRKVKNLFATMDQSGDGVINFEEFSKLVQSPMLQFLLSQLDLEYHDLLSLFEFLDNGDGEITLTERQGCKNRARWQRDTEFLDGAAKLRGGAKALDIWRMETKIEVLFVEVLSALRGNVDVQEAFEEQDLQISEMESEHHPERAKQHQVAPPLAAAILALRGQRSHLVLRARGAFKGYETKRIDTQPGMAPETEELGIDEMDRKGDASTLTRPTRRRLPRNCHWEFSVLVH